MPDYRRAYIPNGAVFLTLVTFNRRPIFAGLEKVQRLRWGYGYRKSRNAFCCYSGGDFA